MSDSPAGMPRLDSATWASSSLLRQWLVASRADVLVLTFQSAMLGGLLALADGIVAPVLWLWCVVGLLLAHATNNQLNDYVDYRTGVDTNDYFRVRYGTHVLHDGLMNDGEMRRMIAVTGGLALTVGLIVAFLTDWSVLWLIIGGAVFLLFYTWPMKHWGLGEIAVFLVWGPMMIAGVDWVLRGYLDPGVLIASCVFALPPTLVIFGKHIDKLETDRTRGVGTLPVRLGIETSLMVMLVMVVLLYAGMVALIVAGTLTPWVLVVALSLPSARRLVSTLRSERPAEPPPALPEGVWPLWYVAWAFGFARQFGLFLLAGLVAGLLAG